jgi:hypothetical protein
MGFIDMDFDPYTIFHYTNFYLLLLSDQIYPSPPCGYGIPHGPHRSYFG